MYDATTAAVRELAQRLAVDLRQWAERRARVGHEFADSPRGAATVLPEAGRSGAERLKRIMPDTPHRYAGGTEGRRVDPRLAYRPPDRKMLAEYNELYKLGRSAGDNPSLQPEVVRRNREYFERYPEAKASATGRQLAHFNALHRTMETMSKELGIGVPELRTRMKTELSGLFAGKSVGIRTSPESLAKILESGRYRPDPTHTTGRKRNEESWFGYPQDHPPEQRPVYGYVMIDGERAAGSPETDMLSNYGRCEIVLGSEVRGRTTACIGDSDYYSSGSWGGGPRTAPSPLVDPEPESFGLVEQSNRERQNEPLRGIDRDYSSESFRQRQFAEAQIHGGVTLADIDHVNLPESPPTALREALDNAGIQWRVLAS